MCRVNPNNHKYKYLLDVATIQILNVNCLNTPQNKTQYYKGYDESVTRFHKDLPRYTAILDVRVFVSISESIAVCHLRSHVYKMRAIILRRVNRA